MASSSEVVLANLSSRSSGFEEDGVQSVLSRRSQEQPLELEQVSLPQADGGKQAWMFLLGCFFIEALIWGFPFSFGVFQEYYENHEPFSKEPSGITTIGTTAMASALVLVITCPLKLTSVKGIMYLSAPLVSALLAAFPYHIRYCSFVGLAIILVALVASSFATHVWHLILTQGVLYAIGGGLLYFPTIVYLDEWFVRRKGFAFGIMWAGTGASGVAIPFIMDWGLNRYSFSTMIRAWAIVMLVLSGPLLYFVKPRIPLSRTASRSRRLDFGFLKNKTFWILQTGNILESLGFFMPGVWLPTYARAIGLSSVAGTVALSLFNSSSVFGTVIMGSLTDRFHVTSVIGIATIGATLSVFLLWGFATSLPLLCIFSLLYGLTAGGFSSTWAAMIREVKKTDDRAEPGLVFGLWAAGRGIGSVVSGPLSEALVSGKPWEGEASLGYGSGYGLLIMFTGVSAMLGGTAWVGRRAGWI